MPNALFLLTSRAVRCPVFGPPCSDRFGDPDESAARPGQPVARIRLPSTPDLEDLESSASTYLARESVLASARREPGRPNHVANGALDTIRIFGVERCMFASNFPVDGLCADFRTIVAGFQAITADREESERQKLFLDNARRIYRLEPQADAQR
ncbi:MAG: amidohydrolase family protein [Rhizobiales bacterium]|nr:amidohydrolase family protein [Hyphomicrobiales bacterium]